MMYAPTLATQHNILLTMSKVEASIADQVHLTTHQGHAMPKWMRSIFFSGTYSQGYLMAACN